MSLQGHYHGEGRERDDLGLCLPVAHCIPDDQSVEIVKESDAGPIVSHAVCKITQELRHPSEVLSNHRSQDLSTRKVLSLSNIVHLGRAVSRGQLYPVFPPEGIYDRDMSWCNFGDGIILLYTYIDMLK